MGDAAMTKDLTKIKAGDTLILRNGGREVCATNINQIIRSNNGMWGENGEWNIFSTERTSFDIIDYEPAPEKREESEFGRGYAYCLGLFLAHEWKMFEMREKAKEHSYYNASSWFNGSADHLFELEIPIVLPDDKKRQISSFQARCLKFRLCMGNEECSWDDATDALNEAKDLLREWDEFNSIPSVKGGWQ